MAATRHWYRRRIIGVEGSGQEREKLWVAETVPSREISEEAICQK